MTPYLLDTSVVIDYLRGKQQVVELLNTIEGELCSSYICLAEVYEGIYRVTNPAKIEEDVNKFFLSLSFVYGVDAKVAKKFGEIRAELKSKGEVIEDFDIMLAATCLVYNLTLITSNKKHFSHVANLQIYP